MQTQSARKIYYLIVVAQFCGTSVWFAGNAVLPQLQSQNGWETSYLTSSTQLGFIAGTLFFAMSGISDKSSPSKLFFISSILASVLNALMLIDTSSFSLILITRLAVGISLAGIYPVGMKIAADWNEHGLGHWLGALVGALVLGSALPYMLRLLPTLPDAGSMILAVSILCCVGGLIVFLFVGDGPFRKTATSFSFSAITKAFASPDFRAPAFGYFGHMWELYAMWAFIPAIFVHYAELNSASLNVSAMSFIVIGAGAVGCYFGGMLSTRFGSATVATYALFCSGLCCVLFPFALGLPLTPFVLFMIFWGVAMAADSPQFSALVSKHAAAEVRGSAITIVVCVGFMITIFSIQLIAYLKNVLPFSYIFLALVPGPLFGCIAMWKTLTKSPLAQKL